MLFCKKAIEEGGTLKPLIINSDDMVYPSITNTSVLNWNGKLVVNIRNVNYTLYHSEKNKYEHVWGPLVYIHPENDIKLKTVNYFAYINDDLEVEKYHLIDTSEHDWEKPLWEFHGLEDARLVEWDGKLYHCGVRRDTTDNGQGRMELSELKVEENKVTEVSRLRIPGPPPDKEYCMKNCTPVLDNPYHLLKWTNPTAFMKFDPEGKEDTIVFETNTYTKFDKNQADLRGGGQVIPFNDGYLTIAHETFLFKSEQNRKNATYRHRLVYWDKDFKEQKFSEQFSFLNMEIEFCCGIAEWKDKIVFTFGAQDNLAYILSVPKKIIEDMINE